MNIRKNIKLVGSLLILAFVGLVFSAMLALIISPSAMHRSARPEHLPVGTTSRGLATPMAYVTLPAKAAPAAAQAPFSTPNTQPEAPTATVVANDTPVESPVEPTLVETSRSDPESNATQSSATPTVLSAALSAPAAPHPTATSVPELTPSPTPTSTSPGVPTPTPLTPGRIRGRVLLDGAPAQGVHLKLEDEAYNMVDQTTVKSDGSFVFSGLEPSNRGYNVVFAQKWNTQYDIDEVISWGWIGPVAVDGGTDVEVPEFDLSLQGFGGVKPEPNAAISAEALSPESPLQFEWTAHPQAVAYWVDLAQGEKDEQEVIWQSSPSQGDSLPFDGTLEDGEQIQTGDYWWGVGARNDAGAYPVTMYAYLSALRIKP